MQNIMFKKIKLLVISLISIFTLFIIIVFIYNQNTMIITMKSDSSPLRSQVYFTTEGKPFVEENSRKNYKVKKDQYFFYLPKFAVMQYVRLDPARKKTNISIEKITIIRDRWFKTRIYDVPVLNIIPNHQIEHFQQSAKNVSFTTTGNDPQFNIRFSYKELSVTRNFRIELLLIAILLFGVLKYLVHIYKTNKKKNYKMSTHEGLYIIPIKHHTLMVSVFLLILGSHLLDYYPQFFIFTAVILIDWRKIYFKEVLILAVFLLSVYITLLFLDRDIIHNLDKAVKTLSSALMLFLAYLLGLSVYNVSVHKTIKMDKIIFYLFFGFFVAYTLSLLYSYMVIPEDNPITINGMYVRFQNEYKRLNVNGGNLISTIIAYYLTFAVIILPFILFYFKEFRARKFNYFELLFLLGCAFFALYLAAEMGRRTVIFLLLLTFLYLGVSIIVNKLKASNYYHILLVAITMIFLTVLFYYLFADTMAVKRLMSLDITQVKRFQFWSPGLEAMLDYPFGGGHSVPVGHNMKLAHNTWIDIGKDFGIIPFVTSIVFFLIHIPYLVHVFFSKNIQSLIKHIFVVIFVCFIVIMMIEPVFTSDKTFFFYIIFYLGFLKSYSDSFRSCE